MAQRASILINCSRLESDFIHKQAGNDRRSISGYVLKIVLGYVIFEEDILAKFRPVQRAAGLSPWKRPVQASGPRATFLIRCSEDESRRIRAAAKRRDVSISGYVLSSLRRTWKIQTETGRMPIQPKLPRAS